MTTNSAFSIAPPALSTSQTDTFEVAKPVIDPSKIEILGKTDLYERYEINRTVKEIQEGGWTRVGLQFPDSMLPHAVKVYEELDNVLNQLEPSSQDISKLSLEDSSNPTRISTQLFILADTSYAACCPDEVAAEHVSAQVLVHYGPSCHSPTSRLPVIHVFTILPIDISNIISTFKSTITNLDHKILLIASTQYLAHIPTLYNSLLTAGYTDIWATEVTHAPTNFIPNRTCPPKHDIPNYTIFHLGSPPTSLLLALATLPSPLYIYDPTASLPAPNTALTPATSASPLLRRRYALTLSLATSRIIGILVATLSVSQYTAAIRFVQRRIAAAGKKSYVIVVGKVNAAKIANFAEVDGWVVVGCWESSLIEDSSQFYRPMGTVFELGVALQGEARVWGAEWWGGFEKALDDEESKQDQTGGENGAGSVPAEASHVKDAIQIQEQGDSDEDEPPEFDLRTGRYISRTRPMKQNALETSTNPNATSKTLIPRFKGELTRIGGVPSPGAEFLRENRTWQGLGSDFETDFTTTGALVEEGRSGIARGYTVGEDSNRT